MKKFLLIAIILSPMIAQAKVPYWQSVYPAYNLGGYSAGVDPVKGYYAPPAGWGWPMPRRFPYVYAPWNVIDYKAIYSYFDAYPVTDQSQHVLVRDTVFKGGDGDNAADVIESRGSIFVSKGTDVQLEWACEPQQEGQGDFDPPDNADTLYNYQMNYYGAGVQTYGFEPKYSDPNPHDQTSWSWLGSSVVSPTATTVYSIRCRLWIQSPIKTVQEKYETGVVYSHLGYGDPIAPTKVLNIKINVCTSFLPEITPGIYKLSPGATARPGINIVVDGKSYAFCISNTTNNTYLIPAGSAAELDAFEAKVDSGELKDNIGQVSFQ